MRNSFVRSAFVAGLLAFPMPAIVIAQQTADLRTGVERDARTVLQRPVSVAFKDVSLERAVKTIAEQARVRIQYQMDMVEQVTRPVSVKAENLPLGVVLSQVLAGTQLYAVPSAADVLTIRRVQQTSQSVTADGVIAGRVTSAKTKQPVAGATVGIGGSRHIVTGDDGTFRITVAAGSHAVNVRAVGFVRQVKTITVTEGGTASLDVMLEPSASVLDEVIVTGTVAATARKEIPNPITVITAEDIEKRGITRIEQLMRGEVPGVIALDVGIAAYQGGTSFNDASGLGRMVVSEIYSRGSAGLESNANGRPTPLKTFVDGVELLDGSYLGTLDPRSIERIEIVTGPQAATIYGSGAMGGVMQIFTKRGAEGMSHDLAVSLRYGMLQSNLSNAITPSHNHSLGVTGSVGPAFSYSTTASYDYVGQWQPDLYSRRSGASAGITSRIGPVSIGGSVGVTSTSNGASGYVTGMYSPTMLQKILNGDWEMRNFAGARSSRISETSNQTLGLNVDYTLRDNWQHSATVGRAQNHFSLLPVSPELATPADTLYKTSEATGQRTNWSYNSTISNRVMTLLSSNLTIGVSGTRSHRTLFSACTNATSSTEYVACGTTSSTAIKVSKDPNQDNWGGFVNWRVGVFDQLYVTFGLRGERDEAYGRDHKIDWTPTNGAAYTMEVRDVTIKLLASYGRATKSPPPDSRLRSDYCNSYMEPYCVEQIRGNPNIGPEYSRGPQGGVEVYWGNRGSFSVNHYKQRVTDLLQRVIIDSVLYVWSGGDPQYRDIKQWNNIGSIKQYGWEATGAFNLGPLAINGTYSWNESRIERLVKLGDGGVSPRFHVGGSFTNVPTHIGAIRVSYSLGSTSISLDNSFIGKSLSTSVDYHGNDAWYYDLVYSRMKMYNFGVRRSSGNTLVPKRGYNKSNLSASQRVNQWASVTLNITNLGNSFASDSELTNPTLGRQTAIGVSIRHPLGR